MYKLNLKETTDNPVNFQLFAGKIAIICTNWFETHAAVAPTQREAFERAREIAKNQGEEVSIHNKTGQIRAKHSYGNDPCPPQG